MDTVGTDPSTERFPFQQIDNSAETIFHFQMEEAHVANMRIALILPHVQAIRLYGYVRMH